MAWVPLYTRRDQPRANWRRSRLLLSQWWKVLPEKLPSDDITEADIRALHSVKYVGAKTIEWLLQLHAHGECDYLLELRRRARA